MSKNKMKTNKTLLKRVKITKTGKLMKKSVGMGHLKEKKSNSMKLRKSLIIEQKNRGHKKMFKKMLTNNMRRK